MTSDLSPENSTILTARGLTRTIRVDSVDQQIIDSFTFDFERGRIYTIVGPSGSGKTSLLRLFNRLDEKSAGELIYNGRSITAYHPTELRRKIALVFQVPYLFPGTVTSNLTYCHKENLSSDTNPASTYLPLVGLDVNLADSDPEKLSVGQKQRVALARALVQEPDILLLDEPTSALDPGAVRTIEELIVELNQKLGVTIILVTHNFRQALRLDGTSLLLIEGRLIESDLSRNMFDHPGREITRKFINGELR